MKILVYGAGMIGSIIAAQLEQAGYPVSILARGKRAEDLRSYGIVSRTFGGKTYHHAHPTVIETLTPDNHFDLILVVLRRNHHQDVLQTLAANPNYRTVVFLGNNLGDGKDLTAVLDADKVLLGFGGTTGEKRGDIIYYYGDDEHQVVGKIYLGELNGQFTPRLQELKTLFENAHFQVELQKNITAWLKTHAALILPLAFGLYFCDGCNYRLANTRDALLMIYRGIREGFQVLQKNRIPITPWKYKLISMLPEPLGIVFLRKIFNTEFARVGLAGHANRAKDEMVALAQEFQTFIEHSRLKTPNLDALFQVLHAEESNTIPEGSKQMSLNWKPVWIGASLITGLIGVLSYFLSRKRKRK